MIINTTSYASLTIFYFILTSSNNFKTYRLRILSFSIINLSNCSWTLPTKNSNITHLEKQILWSSRKLYKNEIEKMVSTANQQNSHVYLVSNICLRQHPDTHRQSVYMLCMLNVHTYTHTVNKDVGKLHCSTKRIPSITLTISMVS